MKLFSPHFSLLKKAMLGGFAEFSTFQQCGKLVDNLVDFRKCGKVSNVRGFITFTIYVKHYKSSNCFANIPQNVKKYSTTLFGAGFRILPPIGRPHELVYASARMRIFFVA